MLSWLRQSLATSSLLALALVSVAFTSGPTSAQGTPTQLAKVLEGSTKLGDGVVSAFSKGESTLLLLPKSAFERFFLWYGEFVSVPSGIANQLPLGGMTVQFERHANRVFIRDLTATFGSRTVNRQDPRPGQQTGPSLDPIELSIRRANEPPVVGVLPILAEATDGGVLVDVTKLFSDDIETMSARPLVLSTGLMPMAINPLASYITSVRVFPQNFNVRAHLTFVAKDTKSAELPPRGVSLRVGHSFVALPDQPMASRRYDPRVGYFYAGTPTREMGTFIEYESGDGTAQRTAAVILRFRLEKKNPKAPISDPVTPIVFYVGREVPDRWRPYLKAGIEMWKPAFEAAGFSNAIVARDAPDWRTDPDWTPEDVRYSTIRWLAQPNENARGPHIVDPRSGEVLSSHVEVWPQVLGMFSRYYYALMSPLDRRADTLPLSEELQGQILTYVVGHEVGHAIGLRHNHIASTAYTVRQMRDAAFANKWGANASIMAYGRFNQAAQPGDGITQFLPVLGPYDLHAIKWGYGVHGTTPDEERRTMSTLAASAQADRRLIWAAGEMANELAEWSSDPRVLKENTGAERVEATRLGIANVLRSLSTLDRATKGDNTEFAATVSQMQWVHMNLLKSLPKVIAGVDVNPFSNDERAKPIPAEQQREAVAYYLTEGAKSLDVYKAPAVANRVSVIGVDRAVEGLQASLFGELFDGQRLALLESQKTADSRAYGLLEFAQDSYAALWADLTTAPMWRRALQRAYLARMSDILKAELADPKGREALANQLKKQGLPSAFVAAGVQSGAETIFPAWVRQMLPRLINSLDTAASKAASEDDSLHWQNMATMARRIERTAK